VLKCSTICSHPPTLNHRSLRFHQTKTLDSLVVWCSCKRFQSCSRIRKSVEVKPECWDEECTVMGSVVTFWTFFSRDSFFAAEPACLAVVSLATTLIEIFLMIVLIGQNCVLCQSLTSCWCWTICPQCRLANICHGSTTGSCWEQNTLTLNWHFKMTIAILIKTTTIADLTMGQHACCS